MGRLNMDVSDVSARHHRAPEVSSTPCSDPPRPHGRSSYSPTGPHSSQKIASLPCDTRFPEARAGKQVVKETAPLPLNRHISPVEMVSQGRKVGNSGRSSLSTRRTEPGKNPPQKWKEGGSPALTDPAKRQKKADYRWDFHHTTANRSLPNNPPSCAELFCKINFGSGCLPAVKQTKERDSITDVTKAFFEIVALTNRMTLRYERCIHDLETSRPLSVTLLDPSTTERV
ncbi:PREDICTED: uncharacterized protein LOC104757892 [Camelina sativa]|uniref:Uncharacterized protein LOC104757892 n=1 Tax=Camelina sativa TaxID=90675 RepID=A0ABM0X0V6_CAMSA|nr:PREDICTED: uncharacterized protein LOC104757892 [Camelina sativa]XP_010478976.1 PREDICTED: uncharacterized protein LOC104757892 [Camelina sativa]XP_019094895.1 PREDICTED: uncharacterized protein LOC104757892 [Camelina sativa]